MRFSGFLIAALAAIPSVLAVDQTTSAIVWFEDKNTPDWVITKAKDDMIKAGGKITHTYTIIKGFAVVAPKKALESVSVSAYGTEHQIRVEEDDVVSIDN